jgi:hypothetical protein
MFLILLPGQQGISIPEINKAHKTNYAGPPEPGFHKS